MDLILSAAQEQYASTTVCKQAIIGRSEPGIGFGLGFAIVMDPTVANTPEGRNSFYWSGAYGTWFWIDPTNDVVVVGMMQNVGGSQPTGGSPQVRPQSRQLVYQALVDPTK